MLATRKEASLVGGSAPVGQPACARQTCATERTHDFVLQSTEIEIATISPHKMHNEALFVGNSRDFMQDESHSSGNNVQVTRFWLEATCLEARMQASPQLHSKYVTATMHHRRYQASKCFVVAVNHNG